MSLTHGCHCAEPPARYFTRPTGNRPVRPENYIYAMLQAGKTKKKKHSSFNFHVSKKELTLGGICNKVILVILDYLSKYIRYISIILNNAIAKC